MRANNAFLQYLGDKFYDQFCDKIEEFFRYHLGILEDKLPDAVRVEGAEVEDLDFKNIAIEDESGPKISFDVLVAPEIDAKALYRGDDYDEHEVNDIWLSVSCSAEIGREITNFRIQYIDELSKRGPSKKPLDGNLVPIVGRCDYDKEAEAILEKYDPEALDGSEKVNLKRITDGMKLNVIERKISEDGSIFGQVFFETSATEFFDPSTGCPRKEQVNANTVVVDRNSSSIFSLGSANITIAHEIVHAFYHRKAFEFARMLNKDLAFVQCQKRGGIKTAVPSQTTAWMEAQANAIAPHILMPKAAFKKKADELFEQYSHFPSSDLLDLVPTIINELALFFDVTIYSARKRLIELGYEIAVGACNWVDGEYVRTFEFKKGTLKPDETFTVSSKDLTANAFADPSLFTAFLSGRLVFAENHVCLDDPKFVTRAKTGVLVLTPYGRHHADECCVRFSCRLIGGGGDGGFATACYLCRQQNPELQFQIASSGVGSLLSSDNPKEEVEKYTKELRELMLVQAKPSLADSLKYLIDYRETDVKQLAADSGLSEKTIDRYLEKKRPEPDKRTVIAICRALKLYPKVSNVILEQAGISFIPNDPEDNALSLVLMMVDATPETINAFLMKQGYKPLSDQRE